MKSDTSMAIGEFHFLQDSGQQFISIPTGPDLNGFLVFDQKRRFHRKLAVYAGTDLHNHLCQSIWFQFKDSEVNPFPKVIEIGEDDGMPFYVAELPKGEPLESFASRYNLSIPYAAQLILDFVDALRCQSALSICDWKISMSSLWIHQKQSGQLQICLGDLALTREDKDKNSLVPLIVNLFESLAGVCQSRAFASALGNENINFSKVINLLKRLACTPCVDGQPPSPENYFEPQLQPFQTSPIKVVDSHSGEKMASMAQPDNQKSNAVERQPKPSLIKASLQFNSIKNKPITKFLSKLAIHTVLGLAIGFLCYFAFNLFAQEAPPAGIAPNPVVQTSAN